MHKRIRKRIVIGFAFLIFLIIFLVNLPTFLSVTRLDHQIKNYVVQKMITGGESILNVNDIHIGFKRITVENVDFINKTRQITTVIKGIEFDYSILKLILNPDKPYKAIDEIYFTEPQLVLQERVGGNGSADTTDTRLSSVLNGLRELNFERIMIENARLILKRSNGEYLSIANDLKGWVENDTQDHLHVALSGKLARSYRENFNLNFVIYPENQVVEGEIAFINYQLNLLNDLHPYDAVSISKGVLDSRLTFKIDKFSLENLALYGSVSVSGVESRIFNNQLKTFSFNASLFGKKLLIDNAHGTIDNSPFSIHAEINDLFHPVLEGNLLFQAFELSSLATYLKTDGFSGSTVEAAATFQIAEDHYVFDIHLSAPQFSYNEQVIHHFKADVLIRPGCITVDSADLNYFGFNIHSRCAISLEEGNYTCFFKGSRQFKEHIFFDKISLANQLWSLHMEGNFKESKLDGQWDYFITTSGDTLINTAGSIRLAHDVFKFATYKQGTDDFVLLLEMSDIFQSPTVNFGHLKNPPLKKMTSNKWIHDLVNNFEIESILAGTFNDINTDFRLLNRKSSAYNIIVTASLNELMLPEKKVQSTINMMHLEAQCDLVLGQDYLVGDVIAGEFLRGDINIDLRRTPQIESKITIDQMKLNQVLMHNTFGDEGEINGDVAITGLLEAPVIRANLAGDKLILNDVGYYKILLDVQSDIDGITIEPMQVLLNNVPVLEGRLGLNLKERQIALEAKGEEIAAEYFLKTFTGGEEIISEKVNYQLTVNGPLRIPTSTLKISLQNGELVHIPFEHLDIELRDSLITDTSYFNLQNHLLSIKNISVINGGHYHLDGSGTVPLISTGPIDLAFNFNGDVLSFLPKWHNFFTDGVSFASIKGVIRGTPRSPHIVKLQADIERGELWLQDVADHIENIHGRIALEPGTNRINFDHIYAEVGGQRTLFNTVRGITTSDGRQLENWYFKNLNTDFGILSIETLDEGVELHIPDLMGDGETSILHITGRKKGETFYFAGPVKNPCAWGQVTLSNSSITFPFLSSGSSNTNTAVEFLKMIDWDVITLAGTDLEYIRDIPALIGYVDTELSIDPSSEGLHFKGILAENEFGVEGKLYSTRGRLDYLDMNFRVENFGVTFNKLEVEPEVYGRAWTTVRDSIGAIPRTIYLELYAYDEQTNQENKRARWEDFKFRLSSADMAIGETQDEVLAYLGYTEANIKDKAKDVGGAVTNNYFIRPLLRPVERSLERFLGMDMIRFNSAVARNLFYSSFRPNTDPEGAFTNQPFTSPYLYLMESSEVTVGKYLSRDLYLSYTGQLVLNAFEQENTFNFNHSVGLEYRFLNNLLIELEYDREFLEYYKIYTNKLYQDDFKIRLRHSFTF